MKFGIFYVLECPDHDFTRAYREMLEQISYAEKLGFDEVWLAEHHGSDYGSMPSPQVAAAAIAERTERMRIGIAVSNLTFDWPVRIAEDYAMVDVLSGGRLDFGVGRGYQPQEFHNMGVGDIQGESREVFVEALEIIRGLWSKPVGERFSFHGRHFDIDKIDCRPTPVQRPTPPIYIASISPETLDLAADQGYNMLVTPTLMTMPELNSFVVGAKRRLRDHGRDILDLDFPMNWQIHLADNEEVAVENAREALTWYFDAALAAVPQGPGVPPTYERYAELVTATEEAGGMTVEGLRDGGVVYVGDPEGLIRQIDTLHDETGLQHRRRDAGSTSDDTAGSVGDRHPGDQGCPQGNRDDQVLRRKDPARHHRPVHPDPRVAGIQLGSAPGLHVPGGPGGPPLRRPGRGAPRHRRQARPAWLRSTGEPGPDRARAHPSSRGAGPIRRTVRRGAGLGLTRIELPTGQPAALVGQR